MTENLDAIIARSLADAPGLSESLTVSHLVPIVGDVDRYILIAVPQPVSLAELRDVFLLIETADNLSLDELPDAFALAEAPQEIIFREAA